MLKNHYTLCIKNLCFEKYANIQVSLGIYAQGRYHNGGSVGNCPTKFTRVMSIDHGISLCPHKWVNSINVKIYPIAASRSSG